MKVKRRFILGDEWLYYKVYCGERTADLILSETILPLKNSLIEQGWVSKWFFIRYHDPDFHLRMRFLLTDRNHIGQVIETIRNALSTYIDNDVIWSIKTDTYAREIERYGSNTIVSSETLFYYESELLLDVLEMVEDDNLYAIFVMKIMDNILTSFGYNLEEKVLITRSNKEGYWKEFEGNKVLTKGLDKKYRGIKSDLISFLLPGNNIEAYKPLDNRIHAWFEKADPEIKKTIAILTKDKEVSKESLAASYIHMLVNRAFRSKQRFYELVCYDFLNKYYNTISHINKK